MTLTKTGYEAFFIEYVAAYSAFAVVLNIQVTSSGGRFKRFSQRLLRIYVINIEVFLVCAT